MNRSSKTWKTLVHNGPALPAKYIRLPSTVKLLYPGTKVTGLSPVAEESICLYANLLASKNKNTKDKVFQQNFFQDFKKLLNRNLRSKIKNIKKLNFSRIIKHLQKQQEKNNDQRAKLKRKRATDLLKQRHGFCTIDGKKESLGNWMTEPPGIYMGREGHPGRGRIKCRIRPEDITINCSGRCAPPAGHRWNGVVKKPKATWLAKYTNNLGETKYIQMGQESKIKTQNDKKKYDFAQTLGKKIKTIRNTYTKLLNSRHERDRQLGVAIYFIDEFALRIGNEKGKDEADTVGCSTLRREHIRLVSRDKIGFDFKGKDSIRFQKVFKVTSNVYKAVKQFTEKKRKKDQLFDLLKAQDVNNYLKELYPGLSAKVFRTYKASILFQKELKKIPKSKKITEVDLWGVFIRANLEVAKLCNHKKTVNKKSASKAETKLKTSVKLGETKLQALKGTRYKKEEQKLKKNKIKLELNVRGGEFALATSLKNYIDPRITVAWCRKNKFPLEKVWTKMNQKKYIWATKTRQSFAF